MKNTVVCSPWILVSKFTLLLALSCAPLRSAAAEERSPEKDARSERPTRVRPPQDAPQRVAERPNKDAVIREMKGRIEGLKRRHKELSKNGHPEEAAKIEREIHGIHQRLQALSAAQTRRPDRPKKDVLPETLRRALQEREGEIEQFEQRMHHLREAGEHLKAAGKLDEARRVWQEAEKMELRLRMHQEERERNAAKQEAGRNHKETEKLQAQVKELSVMVKELRSEVKKMRGELNSK